MAASPEAFGPAPVQAGCRNVDNPVPAEFELLGKSLARGRTDASNRLEDGNRSPVTGLETRKLSIQVLAVQDGSMLMLGQKDEVLEVVRIFQQTADLNGDLVMKLPNHIVGSWIKWT
jgi:hypothetical protein